MCKHCDEFIQNIVEAIKVTSPDYKDEMNHYLDMLDRLMPGEVVPDDSELAEAWERSHRG